jgi:hypothetical protein
LRFFAAIRFGSLEKRRQVAGTMQDTNDLNPVTHRAIENDVIANGQAAKLRGEVGSFPTQFRHPGQELTFFINDIEPSVGGSRVFPGNAKGGFDEIEVRLACAQDGGHHSPFGRQTATNFVFDFLHVQPSHVAAISLRDAQGDFVAQFFKAEALHIPGIAEPAI